MTSTGSPRESVTVSLAGGGDVDDVGDGDGVALVDGLAMAGDANATGPSVAVAMAG
jgi:hypothetical protein